jgi:hypothetical protein
MKGGDAIAYGSDGCVFSPMLEVKVKDGVRTAVPYSFMGFSGSSSKFATKVFLREDVARNEYNILRLINKVAGGIGVIKVTGAIEQANRVRDTIRPGLWVTPSRKLSVCKKIYDLTDTDTGTVYMIHMERISGTLLNSINPVNPLLHPSAFLDAWTALKKLHTRPEGPILHLDMAPRNIFMNDGKALLGDFGSGYIGGGLESFDDFVKRYVERYGFKLHHLIQFDAISPELILALVYYYQVYLNPPVPHIWDAVNGSWDRSNAIQSFTGDYYRIIHGLEEIPPLNLNTTPPPVKPRPIALNQYAVSKFLTIDNNNEYWVQIDDVFHDLTDQTQTDAELQTFILNLGARSDRKLFAQAALRFIGIPPASISTKQELYNDVMIEADFSAFEQLIRIPLPKPQPQPSTNPFRRLFSKGGAEKRKTRKRAKIMGVDSRTA